MSDVEPNTSSDRTTTLKRRDRRVMELGDFTDEDIAAIERATPPDEAAQFDHEVETPQQRDEKI